MLEFFIGIACRVSFVLGSGNATENESDLDEKDAACSHCGQSGGAQVKRSI